MSVARKEEIGIFIKLLYLRCGLARGDISIG